ncbi:MAG: 2-oxo acid dehydrogenase subunit E2 [Actinomycetota bacterium]|nr:2-oxo acid dehydrogenase subunit E2 [Actinomycetota bacterium]
MTAEHVAEPGRGAPRLQKLAPARRAMVRATCRAVEVPYFSLRTSADVTALFDLRTAIRRSQLGVVPSVNDLVVRAVALALRAHPGVNASYEDGTVAEYPRVNVGVAIAVDGGLVAPAVYDADTKDSVAIAHDTRRLVDLAARGALPLAVLQDGTFTVSNLGMYGIEDFDPLLNPPQAAILGVGAATAGRIRTIRLTLGCDHRVLTGAEGARFLAAVRAHLQAPEQLAPAAVEGGDRIASR